MLAQKSFSLAIVSSVMLLSTGIASAGNIEVNTGDTRVSIKGQAITVESTPTRRTPPSILERLRNWRSPHRSRVPVTVTPSGSGKCKTSSSSHQSNRTSSSGGGTVQTSSSSTSTVCN